ncbi:MAG: hypothetical protein JW774_09615 [Candidatus Aureabacteria bacterium]|nr:hypothetical protein [Candidatus Auribacterota bacterium]
MNKETLSDFVKIIDHVRDKTVILIYTFNSDLEKIAQINLLTSPFQCLSLSQIENGQFHPGASALFEENKPSFFPVSSAPHHDLPWTTLKEIMAEKLAGKTTPLPLLMKWMCSFFESEKMVLFRQKDSHFEWTADSGLSSALHDLFLKSFFPLNSPLCQILMTSQPCAALPHIVPEIKAVSREITDLLQMLHMGGAVLLETDPCSYLLFFSSKQTGFPFSWHEIQSLRNMGKYLLSTSPKPTAEEMKSMASFTPEPSSEKNSFTSLRALANRTSNEFKNALVSIKTFAQLLPQRYKDPHFRKDFFHVMTGEVERLEKLMETISFFSSDCILKTVSLDLIQLLEESYEIIREHFSGIKLKINTAENTFFLMADPVLLKNTFLHLMTNAAQAMKESGTIEITVDPLVSPENRLQGFVKITLQDSGCGLDPSLSEKWFEPFFSTKASGLGLGLAYVKKVIEAHGGTIRLSNRKESGASVTVELPLQPLQSENHLKTLIDTNSLSN